MCLLEEVVLHISRSCYLYVFIKIGTNIIKSVHHDSQNCLISVYFKKIIGFSKLTLIAH